MDAVKETVWAGRKAEEVAREGGASREGSDWKARLERSTDGPADDAETRVPLIVQGGSHGGPGCATLATVRWWRRWPRTEGEWWAQADALAGETRQAIIEVATEVGAPDLAARAN